MLAKHALYQLSYGPTTRRSGASWGRPLGGTTHKAIRHPKEGMSPEAPKVRREMVGPGRFELPTSRLSGVRSNQLSYGPSNEAGSRGVKAPSTAAVFVSP